MIQRRDLDELQTVQIPGTEGGTGPFLSPDGRWLGFITRDGVYKVPVEGGVPLRIAAIGGINAADWGEDGMIYLGPLAGGRSGDVAIYQVSANGGEPTVFGRLEGAEGNVWLPEVLPGGRTVLASVLGEGSKLVAFHADGTREIVLDEVFEGRYVEPGYLLYRDNGNEATMAVPFDADAVRVVGAPVALTEPIHASYCFDVSPTGMLAYVPSPFDQGRAELVRVRPDGSSRRLSDLRNTWIQPRVSPDGKKIVVRETGSQCQLWLLDVERGTFSRLAREGDCHDPVWSPDGRRVLFDRGGMGEIVALEVGGARAVEVIASGPDRGTPHSWNGAKNLLVFTRNGPEGDLDLWIRDMETGEVAPFLETPEFERDPVFSPDGSLIAYSSDEGSSAEVYVRAYPADGSAWQVSAGGGRSPVWSSDGSELYFLRVEDGAMMRSRVTRADGFSFSAPEPYIENTFSLANTRNYDVGPDGSFVSAAGSERVPELKIRVVLNWPQLLEERGAR
jgi:serine/threonine-protein kinase